MAAGGLLKRGARTTGSGQGGRNPEGEVEDAACVLDYWGAVRAVTDKKRGAFVRTVAPVGCCRPPSILLPP